MRKFVCLYLNTGGGHRSAAKVLKQVLEQTYVDVSVELVNGIGPKDYLARFLFETCYKIACNYVSGSWALFYELAQFRWVQRLIILITSPYTSWYLKRNIKKHAATDVVSFHFALTPSAVSAIRRLGGNINFTTIVTDPFSAHTAWFYEKQVKYLVFSQQVKDGAIKNCGVPEKNISLVPFLLNPKFREPLQIADELALRKKHNIPQEKKVVLLAGGGEGLPNAVPIVQSFLKQKVNFTIIVVCGKDAAAKKVLDMMARLYPSVDLRPMGFISNMDEMVKLCDCAVIKAGPATLMEVLVCNKPVIISTYLHGQELGNVRFAVHNKVGWFISRPKDICTTVYRLLNNDEYLRQTKKRLENLPISTNVFAITEHLYHRL